MAAKKQTWSIGVLSASVIGVLFVMAAALMVMALNWTMKRHALEEARVRARIVLDQNLAVHSFYAKQLKPALFPRLEEEISRGYFEPVWMSSTYAVREINTYSKLSDEFDYYYKECAINARASANEADPVEREFIRRLNADASLEEQSAVREIDGRPYFVVLRRGEAMAEGCLRCHSTAAAAPRGLLGHYPQGRSFGRRQGEVVSAISIRIPLATPYSHANRTSLQLALFLVVVLAGLYSLQFWLHRRLLLIPLRLVTHKAEEVALGAEHLGETIPPPAGRELRELVVAFNTMSVTMGENLNALRQQAAELLQLNRKLRQSEASLWQFKFISDHSLDAHFLLDRDGRIGYVNAAACRLLGYTAEELLMLGATDLEIARDLETFRELFEGGQRRSRAPVEMAITRKDGSAFPAELTVTGYTLEGDPRLFAALRDITGRKRVEEALRQSEANYMDLFENAPDIYLAVDAATGLIAQCNQAVTTILGYAKEELLGRPVLDLYHPDCQEEAGKSFARLRESGRLHDQGLCLRRKDGSKLDISLNVSSVLDDNGGILYSRSIIHDITERKRHDAINASRLHLMQFAATHGLGELLEEALNEAEKLTGSCIGFYHLVDEDHATLTLQSWSTRTKAEFCRAPARAEHYAVAKAGVWVDCLHQRKPVIHNSYATLPHRRGMPEGHPGVIRELVTPVLRGGRIMAILGVGNKPVDYGESDVEAILLLVDLVWEIVERKQVDEARQKLNEELEQRVRERTAELEAKNEELERLNRLFVGRELKMVELKQRLRAREGASGESPPAGAEKGW